MYWCSILCERKGKAQRARCRADSLNGLEVKEHQRTPPAGAQDVEQQRSVLGLFGLQIVLGGGAGELVLGGAAAQRGDGDQ